MAGDTFIAVGGENLIDYVTHDGVATAHPGGSPYNVAMALGRQDTAVHYISPISNDSWGDMLAEKLVGSGVVLTGGRVDRPTTMARVTVSHGIPDYSFEREGTAERMVTTETLKACLPQSAGAIHTGSLTLIDGPDADAWEAVCADSFASGRLVSLDPNVRLSIVADIDSYRDRLIRMVGKTHVLKLSDEDLEGLFPGHTEDRALAELRAHCSAELLLLTRGENGCSAWQRDLRIDVAAAEPTGLVDTVGAGDTFTATLLTGLADIGALSPPGLSTLEPQALTMLLERAAMAAAINCARAGCNPPSRTELDAALSQKA